MLPNFRRCFLRALRSLSMVATSALSFSFLFRSRLISYCQLESIPGPAAAAAAVVGLVGSAAEAEAEAEEEGVQSTTSVALPVRRTLTALELGARTDVSEPERWAVELEVDVEVEGPTLER